MSDVSHRTARGVEADERLDRVIDDVARQMTAGEPSAQLRERVMAQLSTNGERRTANVRGWWFDVRRWALAPIAVTALILLAIFVGRPLDRREASRDNGPAPHLAGEVLPPSGSSGAPASASNVAQPLSAAKATRPNPLRAGRVTSVVRDTDVEALAPAPMTVAPLEIDPMATESIAVPELETVRPITVAPLATPEG